MVDLSKLAFLTTENYMKREDRPVRYQDVSVAANGATNITITHNLLRVPEFEVGADLQQNGHIWTGTLPYKLMVSSGGGGTPVSGVLRTWITTTALTIRLENPTGSAATYRVWYIIYRDYA